MPRFGRATRILEYPEVQETRRARLESVIMEEISQLIRREVHDPRVAPLTVTSVKVSPDGKVATVYVMVLSAPAEVAAADGGTEDSDHENGSGDGGERPSERPTARDEAAEIRVRDAHERRVRDSVDGLNSAAGFLRRHLSKLISVRHIPSLIFKEDRGLENSIRVHELLRKIGPSVAAADGDDKGKVSE